MKFFTIFVSRWSKWGAIDFDHKKAAFCRGSYYKGALCKSGIGIWDYRLGLWDFWILEYFGVR